MKKNEKVHGRMTFFERAEIFSKVFDIPLENILSVYKSLPHFKTYVPENAWHNVEVCISVTEEYLRKNISPNTKEKDLYIEVIKFLLRKSGKVVSEGIEELTIRKTPRTGNFLSLNFVENIKEDFIIFPVQLGSYRENQIIDDVTKSYQKNEFGLSLINGLSIFIVDPEVCSYFSGGFICAGDQVKNKESISAPALLFENDFDCGGKVILKPIEYHQKSLIHSATAFFNFED